MEMGPRKSSERSSSSKSNSMIYIGAICIIVAGIIGYFIVEKKQVVVKDLVNAPEETLRQTLTGTSPFLFYCQENKENPPSVYMNLMKQRSASMEFALLNCSQVLPSGKTILQKFGLKPKGKNAVVFGTAPWAKPQQVPRASLVDLKSLETFVDIAFAPKPYPVISEKEFNSFCGFAKDIATTRHSVTTTCLLLLRGGQHSKFHADLEQRIVRSFPRTKVAVLDAKMRRLSFESRNTVPVEEFSLMVHAIRNGTHFLRMEDALTWDYVNTFVAESIATPLHQFDADPYGKIAFVKGNSLKFKDRSIPKTSNSKKPDSGGARNPENTDDDSADKEESSSSKSGPSMAEEFEKRQRKEDRKAAREFARSSRAKGKKDEHKPDDKQPDHPGTADDEDADDYSASNSWNDDHEDEDIIEL